MTSLKPSPPTRPIPPVPTRSDALPGCGPVSAPPDCGAPFALRRRSLLVAGLGLATAGALVSCGSSGASGTTASSGRDSSTGSPAAASADASAAGPQYHEASASNTPLSPGSWTGTIGDKEVTLSGAFLVDGVTATIDGGTFESTAADQTVFLVVGGGSLSITNARISKSGDASTDGEHGVDDSYSFYGLNSAVVVVGEGSTAAVDETAVTTGASGANAVLAPPRPSPVARSPPPASPPAACTPPMRASSTAPT